MEEFKLTVTRNIIIKVSTVFLIFLLIKSPSDVWKYTLIMSVGYLISQLYLWFYVKKYLVKTELAFSKILEHVKPILVMFIPVAAYSFYKVMDKIMLGSMCSYEQVGFFQNAEKIINIPMGIITAMGTVMLPKMSNMVSTGEQSKVNGYIELSIKVVTVIGSAIAFGLIGVSEVFTPVFFGNGFEACSALIQLLSITVFFMAWANVTRTQYLIPMKKDKIYIVSATTGAVVNLIFNLILIPRMAAIGAAIGTVLAEFSVMVVQIMMINKEITVAKYIAKSTPYLIIGVIMLIVVNAIGENGKIGILTLTMQITIGGIIYVTLAFGYLHVTKDEMLGLFKIKSKKQK
jgi:O-antigen/teichoic acid export membrane protein